MSKYLNFLVSNIEIIIYNCIFRIFKISTKVGYLNIKWNILHLLNGIQLINGKNANGNIDI